MRDEDDLTPYERERLANIRRNAEVLKQLGLQPREAPAPVQPPKRKRERPAATAARTAREGTRRSLRTRGVVAAAVRDDELEDDASSGAEGPAPLDYASWPIEPTDVDDDEFLAFAALRTFRLKRARELELEPYKIAVNRTLLEMVRRRRNDATWAASSDDDERAADLIQCWGLGPAKAKAPDGFGAELARVLDQPDVLDVVERSRRRSEAVPT